MYSLIIPVVTPYPNSSDPVFFPCCKIKKLKYRKNITETLNFSSERRVYNKDSKDTIYLIHPKPLKEKNSVPE